MAVKRRLQIGDKVRDRAQLGGFIVDTFGGRALVCWNNGVMSWAGIHYLTLDS